MKVNVHGALRPDQPKSDINARVNFLLFWSRGPVWKHKSNGDSALIEMVKYCRKSWKMSHKYETFFGFWKMRN